MDAAMNAYERYLVGKAEVIYSSVDIDASVQVTASENNSKTVTDQLINGINEPSYKWFSFRENKLDGSCHFIPEDKSEEIGWWSENVSNLDGTFDTPIEIEVTFNSRAVGTINVVGDILLDNYPVDFDIELYDGVTLTYTKNVVGNNTSNYLTVIPIQFNTTKIKLIIYSINRGYVASKLVEFYTDVKETYYDDRLLSINVLEELHYDVNGIPLGAVSSNELDMRLLNFDDKFTLGNTDSVVQAYLKKYRKIVPYIGIIDNGTTRWYKMGIFWSVQWQPDESSKSILVTAYDYLEMLKNIQFDTSEVYVNYTATDLFTLILDAGIAGGLSDLEYQIDSAFDSIVIPYAWFEKGSCRSALQLLAEGTLAYVYCDRQGKVKVTKGVTTNDSKITYDDGINVINKNNPSTLAEVTNYVEVESRAPSVVTGQDVYVGTESINVPAGQSVIIECVFSTIPVTAITANSLVGATNTTITNITAYCWGALVTLTNAGGTPETITKITLTGTILKQDTAIVKLAKNDTSIADDGRISTKITHKFIQTSTYAQSIANELLTTYIDSKQNIVLNTFGDLSVVLQDRCSVKDAKTNNVLDYNIIRQDIRYDGGLEVQVLGKYLSVRKQTHKYLSGYTHNDLSAYTHEELNGGLIE
jgi:hypothetical protein